MEAAWPVAITAIGSASAATVAWRQGQRRFVTAIVKGTFALVPGGSMALIAPEPIFAVEQEGAPGLGLRAADDLAPYLGQTDISLTGHAAAPRSRATRTVKVRLSILRDDAALLDKALDLEVPGSGAPRPIPIAGMGPISRQWPIRRRLLGAVDPRFLEGTTLEIPASFDWRYFQASSSDQRIGPLRGDEWLLLEGVHPTLERLMTQLPGARGAARLHGLAQIQEGIRPLALALDALHVDVDRRRCTITWRGRFPVSGDLSSLHIVAGIELPGRPLAWPDRPPEAPARSAVEARAEEDPLAGTMVMDAEAAIEAPGEEDPLAGTMIMADDSSARLDSASGGDPLAGTLGIWEDTAAELAAQPATPFRPGLPSTLSAAVTPARAASIVSAEDDPLTGTLGLDEDTGAELAARPATPFQQQQIMPAPVATVHFAPEGDPLQATLGLREGIDAVLAGRPATPFRTDISSPLSVASNPFHAAPAASHDDPLGGTMGLDELTAAALSARAVTPFRQDQSPPLPASAAPSGAAEEDPLAGTLGLLEDTAAVLASRPATPFRSNISSPLSVVSTPARVASPAATAGDPLGGTMGLDGDTAPAALAAEPFQQSVARTPMPPFAGPYVGEEEEMPSGLGAQFLAAMAAISR